MNILVLPLNITCVSSEQLLIGKIDALNECEDGIHTVMSEGIKG